MHFVFALLVVSFSNTIIMNRSLVKGFLDGSKQRRCRVVKWFSTEPSGNSASVISWYPGHIAKAERELTEYLKNVDVVIEVRDARIPFSTTHPMVPTWVGKKPLIVAIARQDMISPSALRDWREFYSRYPAHSDRPDSSIFFIDGKSGAGVTPLKRKALEVGVKINEKRTQKGIQPRAVRAAVIGFPNVGKSALINRLLGKRIARSQNLPGVTRSLQWIRIGGVEGSQENCLELLDSPGIIPARQFDQHGAVRLAICNDIGEASYDRHVVAAAMCDEINRIHRLNPSYVDMNRILERYKMPFNDMNGDEIVYEMAERVYRSNTISAADKLLADFRRGLLSYGSLESPKDIPESLVQSTRKGNDQSKGSQNRMQQAPISIYVNDVGKGQFDGW